MGSVATETYCSRGHAGQNPEVKEYFEVEDNSEAEDNSELEEYSELKDNSEVGEYSELEDNSHVEGYSLHPWGSRVPLSCWPLHCRYLPGHPPGTGRIATSLSRHPGSASHEAAFANWDPWRQTRSEPAMQL